MCSLFDCQLRHLSQQCLQFVRQWVLPEWRQLPGQHCSPLQHCVLSDPLLQLQQRVLQRVRQPLLLLPGQLPQLHLPLRLHLLRHRQQLLPPLLQHLHPHAVQLPLAGQQLHLRTVLVWVLCVQWVLRAVQNRTRDCKFWVI